jgi:hypothetical protein
VRDEIDCIIIDALLLGAAAALDEVADELGSLRSAWAADGADPGAVAWLDDVMYRLGWWAGRLAGQVAGGGAGQA